LANILQLRQRGATAAPGAEFKFLRRRCKLSFHLSLYRASTPERACSQATVSLTCAREKKALKAAEDFEFGVLFLQRKIEGNSLPESSK